MAKAILELPEMPENCKKCLLYSWESDGHILTLICKILLVDGVVQPVEVVLTRLTKKEEMIAR